MVLTSNNTTFTILGLELYRLQEMEETTCRCFKKPMLELPFGRKAERLSLATQTLLFLSFGEFKRECVSLQFAACRENSDILLHVRWLFRFLQRLLFVHGRLNLMRISKMILWQFFKSIMLAFPGGTLDGLRVSCGGSVFPR